MQKINKLEALLDRFDYETEFKLGFAFYLGGASLVGLPGQPVEGILTARRQLADFDIIEEYEELLDPLTARFEKLRRLEKKKKTRHRLFKIQGEAFALANPPPGRGGSRQYPLLG